MDLRPLACLLLVLGTWAGPARAGALVVAAAGLATPQSALHDPEADVYLVSNLRGDPLARDDDGFVSRIAPDGRVLELKWIDGAARGVTLHAPKGMALVGTQLWIADIDRIRRFDRRTGQPRGRPIAIRGATYLSDLCAGPTGVVYCTDMGLRHGKAGLEPSGTQALYRVSPRGKVEVLLNAAQLSRPSGVAASGDRLVLAGQDGELLEVSAQGRVLGRRTAPAGGLAGPVAGPDGTVLVGSGAGRAIYALGADGAFTVRAADLDGPGDLGFDAARGRLLVPLVAAHELRILP